MTAPGERTTTERGEVEQWVDEHADIYGPRWEAANAFARIIDHKMQAQADLLRLHLYWRDDAASFHEDFRSPSFLKSCGQHRWETQDQWLERVLYGPTRAVLAGEPRAPEERDGG